MNATAGRLVLLLPECRSTRQCCCQPPRASASEPHTGEPPRGLAGMGPGANIRSQATNRGESTPSSLDACGSRPYITAA
jgi:hypothetical protein